MQKILTGYSEETLGLCECGKRIGNDGYCDSCDYEGKVSEALVDIITAIALISIAPSLLYILYYARP